MKSKLLLHIGRHKTGTTAIQKYLWSNKDSLLDVHSILYPESQAEGFQHCLIPGAHIPNHPFLSKDRITDPALLHANLCSEVIEKKPSLVVLSSESFCTLALISEQLFQFEINRLQSDFEVVIIDVYRDPFEAAFSSIKHMIRLGLVIDNLGKMLLLLMRQSLSLNEILDRLYPDRLKINYQSSGMINVFMSCVYKFSESLLDPKDAEYLVKADCEERVNEDSQSPLFHAFYFLLHAKWLANPKITPNQASTAALAKIATDLACLVEKKQFEVCANVKQQSKILIREHIANLDAHPNTDILDSSFAHTFLPLLDEAFLLSPSSQKSFQELLGCVFPPGHSPSAVD